MHDYQIIFTKLNSGIIYWQTFKAIDSYEQVQNVKLV